MAFSLKSEILQKLIGGVRQDNSSAWLRFLLAAAGLIVAFAATIFSTAAREAGHLLATYVLASLALILATIVGLGTVPYLARRVATKTVREALDFEVTKAGFLYAVVVLVIGIAALNTGNNLLYIIVAAMLGAMAVSGAASAVALRALELELKLPDHIFAGTEVAATVAVRNPRRLIPSLSISAVPIERKIEKSRWRWVETRFPVPPWRPPERQWLQLPDRKLRRVRVEAAPSGVFHESAYFPLIPAGSRLESSIKLNFRRRGSYRERFSLSTRFPFALLTKTRRAALARELLVYPAVTDSEEVLELLPVLTGRLAAYVRGRGSDLHRIREYLPEDSARDIDWKATAKSGSLKVREFSREDEPRLRVVFDNPAPGELAAQKYERLVSLTASMIWHLARQNVFLSFLAQEYESSGDIYGMLAYLAKATARTGPSILENLFASADYSVVFTGKKRGTIPPVIWASSYFIFLQ